MTIDRGNIERRARQESARTIALANLAVRERFALAPCRARERWRQMRIAVRSCDRWAHIQDRLHARWLMCQDHAGPVPSEAWCWGRMYRDRPIAGPVGRLP